MNYLTTTKFSFSSDALSPDTFGVVRFEGSEGISKCYAFEVMLVSDNLELSLPELLQNPAKLTLHRDDGDVSWRGILLSFEQLHEVNGLAFYRAHLVPRLTWLSFTQHNQVFLDKSVPEIIEACLKDGGLTGADFEMRLQGSYDPIEYVCQYSESHLNFVSRWCEREGIYYFFEQSDAGEKVIFTDTQISHTPYSQGDNLTYSPPSGLESGHEREIVQSFHCRVNLTPQSVLLKDYNYRKPSLEVSGSADVDAMGRGQVYSYGDHIRTPEEGNRLAKIKAEGFLCRKEVFEGEGSVPYMMPGYTFTLKDHYRKNFNQTYLVTDVSHEGNQTGYLLAGITMGEEDRGVWYRNSFSSIVSSVQFRLVQDTEKPRISGTLTAKIDAAGSGQYAELDTQGRYTVIVPFDTSGRKDAKASAPIRMAQPYAGGGHGMHFPLHKGTEVLLTFIDGDPDRPIIQAAVPNPEHPSPVNVNNQTMSAITTAGGNKIHIEDQAGSERILMHSPNQKSFIRVGAPNDPSWADEYKEMWKEYASGDEWNAPPVAGGIAESSQGLLDIETKWQFSIILGESTSTVLGFRMWFTLLAAVDGVFGGRVNLQLPDAWALKNGHHEAGVDNLYTAVRGIVTTGINQNIAGERDALLVHERDLTLGRVRAVGNATQLRGHTIEDSVTTVDTALENTEANTQTLQTTGNKITNSVEQINSMGAHLDTAGDHMSNALDHTEVIGAAVHTAGLSVIDASANLTQAGGLLLRN